VSKAKRRAGLVLLFLLFARLLFGALALSRTADEASHITSGYTVLARGLEGVWTVPLRGHPLLIDAWLALPVYTGQPDLPLEGLDGWRSDYSRYVDSFDRALALDGSALFSARVQEMLLTVLLSAAVWRWATDLWGLNAGLLALGVLAFDPTLIAHGRLATNDLGLVMVGTWTLYNAWRWMQRPSWGRALGTGGLITLTMLSKGSGVLWAAAPALVMFYCVVRPCGEQPQPARWRLTVVMQWAAAGLVSLFLLWAAYGFSWGRTGDLPLALPAPLYWEGVLFHSNIVRDRWVYALGQRTTGRWWWYFAFAFAVKNPLPLLIAAGIGLWEIFIGRRQPRLGILALFPLLYAVVATLFGLNVGYRHMLPVHPFLYLAIAGGLTQLWDDWRLGKLAFAHRIRWLVPGALVALAVWYVVASVGIYPNEIAYFNELLGGPEAGFRYLVDSNLDWGQASHVRSAYVRAHPDVRDEPPAHPIHPEPGRYIVGASPLQGVGIADPYAYEWLRHREPEAMIDYSLLVYQVPSLDISWVAQCDRPRTPLSETRVREAFGRDVRVVEFDCTQTWVYPGGWDERGVIALHHDLVDRRVPCLPGQIPCAPVPHDPFVGRRLLGARVSYEQEYGNRGLPFVLYELPAGAPRVSTLACATQANVAPSALGGSLCRAGPVSTGGPLIFLQAVAHHDGGAVEVDTWWQVSEGPIARSFSVLGHLMLPDGQIVGQSDGLGVSPLALLPGDVLIQRHTFEVSPTGEFWLRTGGYWADTMERWTVGASPGDDVLLVRLDR
jgi:hypothetical protein